MASWKPGQSGNPRGRPKKQRSLTEALERELHRTVTLPDGSHMTGKRYVAHLTTQALTTGKIVLASGKVIDLSPDDTIALLQWSYRQTDGPPPQMVKHSGDDDGDPISVRLTNLGNILGQVYGSDDERDPD